MRPLLLSAPHATAACRDHCKAVGAPVATTAFDAYVVKLQPIVGAVHVLLDLKSDRYGRRSYCRHCGSKQPRDRSSLDKPLSRLLD